MYLYIFEFGSLIFVFLATAAYFAVLAAYGYFTKADLTRLRPILFTGLVFLFVFALVSLFIPGFTALDRIFCLAGIAIFLGYTAYDTQKIKAYYNYYAATPTCWRRRLFSPPFSCTWISSTCFCTCCAFWASPGIERAAEQRKRGPVSQTGPLFHFVHR